MVIFQILVILQIEDHTKIVPFNRFRFFQDIDFLIAKKWSLLVGICNLISQVITIKKMCGHSVLNEVRHFFRSVIYTARK